MPANTTKQSPASLSSRPSGALPFFARLTIGIVACLLAIVLIVFTSSASYNRLYRRNPSFRLVYLDLQIDNPSLQASVEKDLAKCGVTGFSALQQQHFPEGYQPQENDVRQLMEPGKEESFVHLPELDMKELRKTLLLNPRIEDAKLQRIYPDTLRVKIEQRLPVAILHFPPNSGKSELLIDANGIVLPRDLAAATNRLPSIIGIKNPDAFIEGVKCENKGVNAFLAFLKESNLREEGANYQILNARMDEAEDRMFLTMAKNKLFKPGAQVVMPLDDVPEEMDRLKTVIEMRISSGETISNINATFQNIPVKP